MSPMKQRKRQKVSRHRYFLVCHTCIWIVYDYIFFCIHMYLQLGRKKRGSLRGRPVAPMNTCDSFFLSWPHSLQLCVLEWVGKNKDPLSLYILVTLSFFRDMHSLHSTLRTRISRIKERLVVPMNARDFFFLSWPLQPLSQQIPKKRYTQNTGAHYWACWLGRERKRERLFFLDNRTDL